MDSLVRVLHFGGGLGLGFRGGGGRGGGRLGAWLFGKLACGSGGVLSVFMDICVCVCVCVCARVNRK